MGYYIEVPEHFDKADQIVVKYGGEIIPPPRSFSAIPKGKALIVVVRNPTFEAAAFCYNEAEFKEFTDPRDWRHHDYVLLDWDKAANLSGFRG